VDVAIEERSESVATSEPRGYDDRTDEDIDKAIVRERERLEQLALLARTIARQVYDANGGTANIAKTPALEAWAPFAFAAGMIESKRPFNEPEASLITDTYRNEIAEFAGQAMEVAAIEDPTEWAPEAGKYERILIRAHLDGMSMDEAHAVALKACPTIETFEASEVGAITSSSTISTENLSRPTDRQLAFVVELLSCTPPLVSGDHRLADEADASQDATCAWLHSLVPPEVHEQVLAEIDSCKACHAPLKMIGGNMVCSECEGSTNAHDVCNPAAEVISATVETSPTEAPTFDSISSSNAAAISAKAAARDAIAAGADPLIVVDLALREIVRFRIKTGLSAQYVAQDPLAALVVELRHKRVPPAFARVARALAAASEEKAQMLGGYDDGHERRCGDWSLAFLLELAGLASMEGTREELTAKALEIAENFASQLPGWQETICDERGGSDLDDPKINAEIDSAADAFIAGLTKAGAP
jgi:uncharacterized Zn finger protein (UPF0148 family)